MEKVSSSRFTSLDRFLASIIVCFTIVIKCWQRDELNLCVTFTPQLFFYSRGAKLAIDKTGTLSIEVTDRVQRFQDYEIANCRCNTPEGSFLLWEIRSSHTNGGKRETREKKTRNKRRRIEFYEMNGLLGLRAITPFLSVSRDIALKNEEKRKIKKKSI